MASPMRSKKDRIYRRDGGICHYCGTLCRPFGGKHNHPDSASVDHVQTRMAGGGNADENLVLACHECNNGRSCIPYDIFVGMELWRREHTHKRNSMARLFAVGGTMKNNTSGVWLLEMYTDFEDANPTVQNWGIFESAQAVHRFMNEKFPDSIHNADDDLDHVGYHFPEDHVLADVSFVANCWDVQA